MRHLMLNKLFEILFAKRLLLLLVWFQSTNIFAQHYSGRHADDSDGSGSGGFIFIIVIIIAIGVFLHFYLLDRDSSPKSSSFAPKAPKEKEPMNIDEIYRRESERIEKKIRQNEEDSKDFGCGCMTFIFSLAFFSFCAFRSSCTNDSDVKHLDKPSINNGHPLNKVGKPTPNPLTDKNGKKLNDLGSIMKYINENEQNSQTDNKKQ